MKFKRGSEVKITMINKDEVKRRINNIIWHIETNRKVLGDQRTLDDVLKSLKNWQQELQNQ